MANGSHSHVRTDAFAPQARWRRREVAEAETVPQPSVAPRSDTSAAAQFGFPFFILCVYTFILIGRPQDYFAVLLPLRLALVFTFLTTVVTLLAWAPGMREVFREPETKAYLFFYAVIVSIIPFAVYRPGSFDFVIMQYFANVVFFVMFVIHVDSMPKLRRIAVVLVCSVFIFTFFSLQMGQFAKGRYATGIHMFDPNDIAFVEVSLLAFALWVLLGSFGLVIKAIALLSVLFGVLLTLYTASRGGLLGLLTFLGLFLWLRVPNVRKSFKTVMLAALVVLAIANLDKINIERYMTLTSLEDDYNFAEFGRKDIWTRGVRLFLERPLTGTGVNTFAAAIGFQRAEEGVIPKWQVAHSVYLEVLTETGIFGTVAFLFLIVRSLKTFNGLRRRGASFRDKDFAILPGLLLTGFIAQLVSGTFLSQTYSMFFTLAFAMSAVLNRIASKEELVQDAKSDARVPITVPPFSSARAVTAWSNR